MTFVVRWRSESGIPAAPLRFQDRTKALDQACALIRAGQQNVEVYEKGKLIPGEKVTAYFNGRPVSFES
jgi:hypothetical protein